MAFAAFRASIVEPRLLTLADHWEAVRGRRLMPGWRDLDPVAIGRELAIVWAWRWDPAADTFVGRLAGHEVEAMIAGSIRGRRIEDVFEPANAVRVRARYLDVLRTPLLLRSTGRLFGYTGRVGTGERIILPLGPDSAGAGGVVGATVYRIDPLAIGQAIQLDDEGAVRELFPLHDMPGA